MSDIQQYLLDYDRNKRDAQAVAHKSAERKFSFRPTCIAAASLTERTGLKSGDLKLLTLVEELGEYLNNDNGPLRAKTMSYLADVLTSAAPKVLSLQQSTSHVVPSHHSNRDTVLKSQQDPCFATSSYPVSKTARV